MQTIASADAFSLFTKLQQQTPVVQQFECGNPWNPDSWGEGNCFTIFAVSMVLLFAISAVFSEDIEAAMNGSGITFMVLLNFLVSSAFKPATLMDSGLFKI